MTFSSSKQTWSMATTRFQKQSWKFSKLCLVGWLYSSKRTWSIATGPQPVFKSTAGNFLRYGLRISQGKENVDGSVQTFFFYNSISDPRTNKSRRLITPSMSGDPIKAETMPRINWPSSKIVSNLRPLKGIADLQVLGLNHHGNAWNWSTQT